MAYSSVGYAERIVNVVIDGEKIIYSEAYGYPYIDQTGRTHVPLKLTMEVFGCEVTWDAANRTAIASMNDIVVKVPIGQKNIFKSEVKIHLYR